MEVAHFVVDYHWACYKCLLCERAVSSLAVWSSCDVCRLHDVLLVFATPLLSSLDVVLIRHGTTLLLNARLYIELQLKNIHLYHFHLWLHFNISACIKFYSHQLVHFFHTTMYQSFKLY